jgi:hypothetical protein
MAHMVEFLPSNQKTLTITRKKRKMKSRLYENELNYFRVEKQDRAFLQ